MSEHERGARRAGWVVLWSVPWIAIAFIAVPFLVILVTVSGSQCSDCIIGSGDVDGVLYAAAGIAWLIGAAALVAGHRAAKLLVAGRGRRQRASRMVALSVAGLAVASLAVYAGVARDYETQREFSGDVFREAREGAFEESDAGRAAEQLLERQANLAVQQRALIGMSPDEVTARLGKPDRTGPRRRLLIWELGMINDYAGPGDQGALYVQFDRHWRRATFASVGQAGPP